MSVSESDLDLEQLSLMLRATPAQRLKWLEEAMNLARQHAILSEKDFDQYD